MMRLLIDNGAVIDVEDDTGWTPLLRLQRCMRGLDVEAFAKLEYLNPMGSIKDRLARFLIDRAIESGELSAGDVVVEASSGNTAMDSG